MGVLLYFFLASLAVLFFLIFYRKQAVKVLEFYAKAIEELYLENYRSYKHIKEFKNRGLIDEEIEELHDREIIKYFSAIASAYQCPLLSSECDSPKHILVRLKLLNKRFIEEFKESVSPWKYTKLLRIVYLQKNEVKMQRRIADEYSALTDCKLVTRPTNNNTSLEEYLTECVNLHELLNEPLNTELINQTMAKLKEIHRSYFKSTEEDTKRETVYVDKDNAERTDELQDAVQEDSICWVLEGQGGHMQVIEPSEHTKVDQYLFDETLEELKQNLKPISAKTLYKSIDDSGNITTSEVSTVKEVEDIPDRVEPEHKPVLSFLSELKAQKVPVADVLEG